MSERVTMPALGESVTEGTVTRWLKAVGDTVEVDEPLLEVSTDKVDTEIPAPFAGILQEILVEEDETVAVGADLAVIGDGARPAAGDAEPSSTGAETQTPPREPQPAGADAAPAQAEAEAATDEASGASDAPAQVTATDQPVQPASSGEGQRVTMPALGESVTEGTVSRWLKAEGDPVEVDEPLLEVSTDKVDTEIPSPVAGTLTTILVQEDETVAVGADLAIIGGAASGSTDEASTSRPTEGAAADRAAAPADHEAEADRPAEDVEVSDLSPQTDSALPPDGEGGDVADQPAGSDPDADTSGASQPTSADLAADPAPAAGGSAQTSATTQPGADEAVGTQTAPAPPSSTGSQAAAQSGASAPEDASAYVTPLVRKLAADHDVDLASVTGTGIGGRIRKQDVLGAAEAATQARAAQESRATAGAQPAPAQPETPSAAAEPAAAPAPASSGAASPKGSSDTSGAKRGTREPMSRLRKVIAQRMVESLQVSAQLTTVVEVDMTKVVRVRDAAKHAFERREGTKLTVLPFIAVATAEALKEHPVVNASVEGEEIVYHGQENLAIAVDTERGLLTPVVKNAGDLNVAGLARAISDLAARTRDSKITPDDLTGGTFTITNTGSRGALFDTPILNQPQVAMLGTGTIVRRPVVVTDGDNGETIAVRSMMYLALSYDHRVVDGADAARFLGTVKARLEDGAFEA